MKVNKRKVPAVLAVTTTVSGGITIVTSLANVLLCVIYMIYRFTCDAGDVSSATGAQYLMLTIYRVYIQDDSCPNSLKFSDLTPSYSVFILTAITLSFATLSFILASALIAALTSRESSRYITIMTYIYIGISLAILVTDITFATHFGIDYTTLSNKLNTGKLGAVENYETEVIRMGALIIMTIILKGYVFHLVNTVLLIYIAIYIIEFVKKCNKAEHNIHKLSILNAYDYPRPHDDPWPTRSDMFTDVPRGNPQFNRSYNDDEIPRARDNPLAAEIGHRHLERSESWLRTQPIASQGLGNRPFSYLEEPKRSNSVRKPTASEQNWRRDWPPPPAVPAPDYSPPARRLKSALKQGYP